MIPDHIHLTIQFAPEVVSALQAVAIVGIGLVAALAIAIGFRGKM